jgi:hypothetical protein
MQTIAMAHSYASRMTREMLEKAKQEKSDDRRDGYELLACAAYPAYFFIGLAKREPSQDARKN